MKHFSTLLLLFTGLWASPTVSAQSLDTSLQPSSLYAPAPVYQVLEQADGKVVLTTTATRLAGTLISSNLIRVTASGAIDNTFSQNVGKAYLPDEVYSLSNNQLLLRGSSGLEAGGIQRNELLRLNADGTADASLNVGTGVGSSNPFDMPYSNALVVQADGKMILAGNFDKFNGVPVRNLVRLNVNGSIDPSFQVVTGPDDEVLACALQADGKLLVGGTFTTVAGVGRPGLARFNTDGTLDASFVPALQTSTQVDAIRIQPDGSILIGGFLNMATGSTTYLTRLTSTGTRDNSFMPPTLNSNLVAGYGLNPFQVQADGRIILVGYFDQVNGIAAPRLVRLNSNGSVDPTFNPGTGPNNIILGAATSASGKIYLSGFFSRFAGTPATVVRLLSSGSTDASFQAQPLRVGQVNALARQPDGKMLIGGVFSELNGQPAHNLARLNADGTTDNTYQVADTQEFGVNCLALQPDGKLLMGTTNNGSNLTTVSVVRRFTTTGASDATFAASAINSRYSVVNSLVLQPDGRVLVGGSFGQVPGGLAGLVRLLPSGQVDGSFAPSIPAGIGNLLRVQALALQPNGQMLVAGQFSAASGSESSVARVMRLAATGAPDASFNTQLTYTQPATLGQGVINALEVQPAGTILVGGQFNLVGGATRAGLTRLTATGQLDAAFNANLSLTSNPGIAVHTVLTQPNGRVLVGGSFSGSGLTTNLARLLTDGRPDASFSIPLGIGRVRALAIQPDGKLLVGGQFSNVGTLPYMGLVRLSDSNVLTVSSRRSAAVLHAWPNPVHGQLHLLLEAAAKPSRLTLLDGLGKTILSQPAPSASLVLPVPALPAGVYLLRVEYADGPVTRRIVVE